MASLLKKLYNCTHSQLLFICLGSLNSSYFLCKVEFAVVCCSELASVFLKENQNRMEEGDS